MPQLFWNAGCQLVALNYQTIGESQRCSLLTELTTQNLNFDFLNLRINVKASQLYFQADISGLAEELQWLDVPLWTHSSL